MGRRKRLTDLQVASLPVRSTAYFHADPEMTGHYVRVTPGGARSFCAVARDPRGRQIWSTIGSAEILKIDEARELARTAIRRIRDGLPAKEKPPALPDSYAAVADNWFRREVEKKNLITQREIKRILQSHILLALGDRPFTEIKRSDVSKLLDKIEDRSGPRMADVVLSYMRSIADWYAKRDDDYVTPFVRKMRRSTAKPRDRILTDDEIRSLWRDADDLGTSGAFIKTLLLTGQRSDVVRTMRWDDLSGEGGQLVWTIPSRERAKGTAGRLKLSALAVDIINGQPRIADNPFVFAGSRTDGPMAIGRTHRRVGDPSNGGWRLHDLRRTHRSLLSRCGINRDVAESVLGHRLIGVEGIYNRFDYFDEKAHALAALAKLITEIIDGTPDKVITLRRCGDAPPIIQTVSAARSAELYAARYAAQTKQKPAPAPMPADDRRPAGRKTRTDPGAGTEHVDNLGTAVLGQSTF
jgi:integrase